MSVAGGLHHALEDAARHRCGAVQLFTKNASQWAARPLDPEAVRTFRETMARLGPFRSAAHDSYLINLASPDRALRERSRRAFIEEIERCELLGLEYLVFHPGAHMGAGEKAGIATAAAGVRQALRSSSGYRTVLLFENTAGQGTCLGGPLEHLTMLLDGAGGEPRAGVCLDTCHLWAAGHDYSTPERYAALRARIVTEIGAERVRWIHCNDAKSALGSRLDRHEHIGRGRIGSRALACFLRDPLWRSTPMVLETPKENEADRRNLAMLRRLSRMR